MHLKMLDIQIPDNPTIKDKVKYLNDHYSYREASFAHNVKIRKLHGITREEADHMLDVLGDDRMVLHLIYNECLTLPRSLSDLGYRIETRGRSDGYFILTHNGVACPWHALDEEDDWGDVEYMFEKVKTFDIACEKACQMLRSF